MSCLQNDILIDKLQFSFSQNQTGLYSHIDANYDIFLQNHNRSFRKHYEHHVLEFNPSFNLNTMHNLENTTEAELKANIFNLFGIHQNISKDRLKALLQTPIYNSIRLTRLHITRDFVCTHSYKTYYDSVKAIKPKHLCLKPISTKGAQSLYFRRRRKGGSSSNTTSLVFYNKGQELLKKGSIKDLSSVPFVRGANITPTQVHGYYDLSQQDIMRIEVALNRRKNQHMISFENFIRLLHGGHLYKFLAKRYKTILCMYLFYEYNVSKHSDAKTLLKEVVLEQGVDIQLFRTLFQFEGVTKTKSQSLDAFLSAITDPYATEILNSL